MAFYFKKHTIHSSDALNYVGNICSLYGDWSLKALVVKKEMATRQSVLRQACRNAECQWDLSGVKQLDYLGAHLLWRAWGGALPKNVRLSSKQNEIFATLSLAPPSRVLPKGFHPLDPLRPLVYVGRIVQRVMFHGRELIVLLGQIVLDVLSLLRRPRLVPWREISAQIYRSGTQALGITALVGCLIGIVLAYLLTQQLRLVGADRFIVKLLGVSIVRELGPMLAAILVAGRSGSAMTAQIGVMRVTQELDALRVMGISCSQRLILPRVLALAISMPLLVLWTDVMALIGGSLATKAQLNISPIWFLQSLPEAISLGTYWIGLIKGATFGVVIASIACYFGLQIQPNTESLGRGTTTSVVIAITAVILVDALFAVTLKDVSL